MVHIICYVAYYSAATFKLPISKPSNMAAKCGIRRSWKLKLKPNLGFRSNIAITISYISVFVFIWIIPRLMELWPYKCQGHPVSLWCWPLTCDFKKCNLLRSSLGMYNPERRLQYSHLLTRNCPCNLLLEPTSPKHEYRRQLSGHPVTSSMTSSPWKTYFWHNLRHPSHIWGQIEALFDILKILKWPPFWGHDKLFLPEVILEVEYTSKIAISISFILSFWSTI